MFEAEQGRVQTKSRQPQAQGAVSEGQHFFLLARRQTLSPLSKPWRRGCLWAQNPLHDSAEFYVQCATKFVHEREKDRRKPLKGNGRGRIRERELK